MSDFWRVASHVNAPLEIQTKTPSVTCNGPVFYSGEGNNNPIIFVLHVWTAFNRG